MDDDFADSLGNTISLWVQKLFLNIEYETI